MVWKRTTTRRERLSGLLVAAPAVLLMMAGGCKEAEKPAVQKEVKAIVLGQPAAFTGPSAGLGIEFWRGARAAFLDYNARPTTKIPVEMLTVDDGYDADRAAAAVRRLAEDPQVFAIFGGVGTPTIVKALPVVEEYFKKNGLFYFSNFTGAQVQREPPYDKFVFNVRASYRDETKALVNFLVEKGRERIGIFIQDDAYGASGKEGVERALSATGRQLTAETRYPRGQTFEISTEPQLKMLRDAKVDAIVAVGAYQACAALIRDARTQGWTVPIANVSFVGADQLLDLVLGEEKRTGVSMTVNLLNSQVVPSYNEVENLIVAEYRVAMDKHKPTRPDVAEPGYKAEKPYTFGSFEGYVSARTFIAILEAVKGPVTRESFMKTAETMGVFNIGLNVATQFAPDRRQALDAVWITYAGPNGWLAVDPRAKVLQ